jgi:hypothetical protein
MVRVTAAGRRVVMKGDCRCAKPFIYRLDHTLGAGQYSLLTFSDHDGKPMDGTSNYRLNVPANAPVLFRLYGPQKAFFDKTWKLPDIEKSN